MGIGALLFVHTVTGFVPPLEGHSAQADSMNSLQLFEKGNELYKNGNPGEALTYYTDLLKKDYHDWRVYYNLGNCYAKTGDTGLAILNYLRARELQPRFSDIDTNLEILYTLREDKGLAGGGSRFLDTVLFVYRKYNLNESALIFSCFFVLLSTTGILLLFAPWNSLLRYLTVFWGICTVLTGFSLAKKTWDHHLGDRAVVIEDEIQVRSGPSTNFILEFELHEGTEVSVVEKRGNWMLIYLSDAMKGWTPAVGVEEIWPVE
jgi:hypothetical protein